MTVTPVRKLQHKLSML
ncbi:hypothetical protein, partial [Shigella sonnei]